MQTENFPYSNGHLPWSKYHLLEFTRSCVLYDALSQCQCQLKLFMRKQRIQRYHIKHFHSTFLKICNEHTSLPDKYGTPLMLWFSHPSVLSLGEPPALYCHLGLGFPAENHRKRSLMCIDTTTIILMGRGILNTMWKPVMTSLVRLT